MPSVTYYHLQPKAALHVGAQGIGQEETLTTVPSDTLFAALVASSLLIEGAANGWSQAFAEPDQAPFILGSAYPYAGDVRFYPVPMVDLAERGLSLVDPKSLRRLRFISEGIWQRLLAGEPLAGLYPGESGGGAFLQGGALWLSREEVEHLPEAMRVVSRPGGGRRARPLEALPHLAVWRTHRVPRVAVDRMGRGTDIYHTGRVTYAPGCGLWFAAAWLKPEARFPGTEQPWRTALEATLNALADAGLGGERAGGYGGFAWTVGGEEQWADPLPGQPSVTLSRYHPRAEELPAAFEGEKVRYQLASVAGHLQSLAAPAQRRRRLWLVAEGSVIKATGRAVMGDVTDVRPLVGTFPHPVWRYGLALPAPLEVPHA
jgi:CRISPR-associated protein Csm4